MSKDLTCLDALEIVLKDTKAPLSAKEILAKIQKSQEDIKISGKTPLKTIHARISVDIKKNGFSSRFKRVGRGLFALRESSDEEYMAKPHQKRMSESVMSDVLVFPSSLLDSLGHFHGILKDYERYATELLNPKNSFPMKRIDAEGNANFKQILSYVIIKYQNEVLRFTRGAISSVGNYLYGQYSIGFGGHVERRDRDLWTYQRGDCGYSKSVERELQEEVKIDLNEFPNALKMVGVLNDDSTELGRRHFAFIHLLELPFPVFKKGEISVNELKLIEIPKLADEFEGYEYWSKLCIHTYFGEQLAIDCHIQTKANFSLRKQSDIILFAGYIGSGKTEACKLLEREFGYTLVPLSRIMQNIIGCESIERIGRRRLQDLGYEFINSPGGHEKLAQGILDFMNKQQGTRFVLDGFRYPDSLKMLSHLLNREVTVIFIESTIDNLYRYYKAREMQPSSFTDFLNIVNHPVERQVERFWPDAHITIYNHGSLDSYIQTLRNFFQKELR